MTSYEVGWHGAAAGSHLRSGWWGRLVAPIVTAILVIALGITVFGLITSGDGAGSPSTPATAEPRSR